MVARVVSGDSGVWMVARGVSGDWMVVSGDSGARGGTRQDQVLRGRGGGTYIYATLYIYLPFVDSSIPFVDSSISFVDSSIPYVNELPF